METVRGILERFQYRLDSIVSPHDIVADAMTDAGLSPHRRCPPARAILLRPLPRPVGGHLKPTAVAVFPLEDGLHTPRLGRVLDRRVVPRVAAAAVGVAGWHRPALSPIRNFAARGVIWPWSSCSSSSSRGMNSRLTQTLMWSPSSSLMCECLYTRRGGIISMRS
jgi:hypothetical protein